MHSLVKISGLRTGLATHLINFSSTSPTPLLISGETVLSHPPGEIRGDHFWPGILPRKGALEMQTRLVLPVFWKPPRCPLLLVACVFGFTEPQIILEVDAYASDKTQADKILNWFFFSVF